MDVLSVLEIDKAYERIKSLILKTPLIYNETINYFKAQCKWK